MSIIRDVEVSLATIISESNLIVEVRCLEVFEEEIPVLSNDETKSLKHFIKKGFVFEVQQFLKKSSDYNLDTLIPVPQENWKRSFSQYKEQHANGPSKSFTVKAYRTEVPSMQQAEILFLSSFQGSHQLVAKNAFETGTKKEEIQRLIEMS